MALTPSCLLRGVGHKMDHLLSITKGLFGIQKKTSEESLQGEAMAVEEMMDEGESYNDGSRKRLRDVCLTPSLMDEHRLPKRIRISVDHEVLPKIVLSDCKQKKTAPLNTLPEDTLAHCLSFLNSSSDRFALQNTNRQFRRISNRKEMLKDVEVGGDQETGYGGIIQEEDTPKTAEKALTPFCEAGNQQAIYM